MAAVVLPFITRFMATFVTSSFLVPLLTRIAAYCGFSLITYSGMNVLISVVLGRLSSGTSGLPASSLAVLQMMHIFDAVNLIFSATVAALTIAGLSSAGSFARVALTPAKGADIFSGLGNFQSL